MSAEAQQQPKTLRASTPTHLHKKMNTHTHTQQKKHASAPGAGEALEVLDHVPGSILPFSWKLYNKKSHGRHQYVENLSFQLQAQSLFPSVALPFVNLSRGKQGCRDIGDLRERQDGLEPNSVGDSYGRRLRLVKARRATNRSPECVGDRNAKHS